MSNFTFMTSDELKAISALLSELDQNSKIQKSEIKAQGGEAIVFLEPIKNQKLYDVDEDLLGYVSWDCILKAHIFHHEEEHNVSDS